MKQVLSFENRVSSHLPWLEDDHVTRLWLNCGFLMLAFGVVIAPAYFLDVRTVDGVNTWSKPLKFALSISVHAFTIAFLAQLLERRDRTSLAMNAAGYLGVVAAIFEQSYIIIQAARARRSHFNFDTQFEALMYAMMGVGALLIILPALVLGIQIWRKSRTKLTTLRVGAIWGLVCGSLLTLFFAGYMSSALSHWIGQTSGDATGLPIVGWSREVGDLRVAHFVATHMMQTIPILGLLLDVKGWRGQAYAIHVAAILMALLSAAVFWQALSGIPLLPR